MSNKITLMIKILLATVGFSFLLSLQASGQLTNHVEIKPGFYFELLNSKCAPCSLFKSSEEIDCVLATTGNQFFYAKRLPREQTYVFDLLDSAGNKLPKTPVGAANSQPIDNSKAHRGHGFGGKYVAMVLFKPDDFFVITNAGVYTLQVQMRFWSEITNKQYGVVTTPPVRVQVVRQ